MVSGISRAQDAGDLAARFGALEDFSHAEISPDGSKVLAIAPAPDGTRPVVVDVVNKGKVVSLPGITADKGSLNWCKWASDQRIVCQVLLPVEAGLVLSTFTRLIAVNVDGTNLRTVSQDTNFYSHYAMSSGGTVIDFDVGDSPGSVLLTRQFVPDTHVGSRIGSWKEGVGVDLVDTATLRRRTVEEPRESASRFWSDGHGNVRMMAVVARDPDGLLTGTQRYYYRKPQSRDWEPLSTTTVSSDGRTIGFAPVAVDAGSNQAYGFLIKDGYEALYSKTLDGTDSLKLVVSRPDADVDELIRVGRSARVVGVSYARERRTAEYFDPELKRLSGALAKALPGNPAVDIVSASAGEKQLLVVASSDRDPGVIYRYDKETRRLDEVFVLRRALEGIPLAPMQPITFRAADGVEVPGYLTLPPGSSGKGLPAIVMPHGGPSSRDEWGFDWLAQFFAARGYAVLQPNYRASSGYGEAWYHNGGFQSWKTAIGDVNAAGRWLLEQGIAAPGKLGAFGWSYGGYAALQGAVVDPSLYKAVVAIAPVTDFAMLKADATNFVNARLVWRYIGDGPHIREGSPAQNADAITAPVLLFHGDRDQNVDVGESRLMAAKLKAAGKPVTYVEFRGLDHYLEDAPARTRMLRESDAFLRRAMGIGN